MPKRKVAAEPETVTTTVAEQTTAKAPSTRSRKKTLKVEETATLSSNTVDDVPATSTRKKSAANEAATVSSVSNVDLSQTERSWSKQTIQNEPDEEELMLRSTLFGFRPSKEERTRSTESDDEIDSHGELPDDALFKVDTAGESGRQDTEQEPVWADSDDDDIKIDLAGTNRLKKLRRDVGESIVSGKEYVERLRVQHEKIVGKSNLGWANAIDQVDMDDSDAEEELRIKQTSSLFPTRKGDKKADRRDRLGRIFVNRLKDGNMAEVSQSVVLALDFHRTTPELMLTGGMDKTLRLFRIDNDRNAKLQSVHFSDLPIYDAKFSGHGSVLLTGRRPFFYSYDVESGDLRKVRGIFGREEERSYETMAVSQENDLIALACTGGVVSLVDRQANFKEQMAVKLVASRASNLVLEGEYSLLANGDGGETYKWDLRRHTTPVWRRRDEGAMRGTALGASGAMGVYATGDSSGILSVYDEESGGKIRSFENLSTSIDSCAFLPSSGKLMAFASKRKKDCVRLVHLPTKSVVKNWPPQKLALGNISCLCFSHTGGLLAAGNDKGRVMIWKVQGFD